MTSADPALQFLDALGQMGGSAGNVRLREKLGWDEATYEHVQSTLKFEGKILSGRGRGGSVKLPGFSDAPSGSSNLFDQVDSDPSEPKALVTKEAPKMPIREPRPAKKLSAKNASNATIGFEAKLWLTADRLRNIMDASEYKHGVLGLHFLKYFSNRLDSRQDEIRAELNRFGIAGCMFEPHRESWNVYQAKCTFWVPPEKNWLNKLPPEYANRWINTLTGKAGAYPRKLNLLSLPSSEYSSMVGRDLNPVLCPLSKLYKKNSMRIRYDNPTST